MALKAADKAGEWALFGDTGGLCEWMVCGVMKNGGFLFFAIGLTPWRCGMANRRAVFDGLISADGRILPIWQAGTCRWVRENG